MAQEQRGKVYEGVLQQLKSYIEEHRLKPGDKLPSERELSEQLNVGRSSIREAFRAMELLGLIETRRGEGTYMRAYRPYHMVELLSNFLLNESRTKSELMTAKQMIEKEVLLLLNGNLDSRNRSDIRAIISDHSYAQRHQKVFEYLFSLCDQPLLLSMWQFISGFTHTVHDVSYSDDWYEELVTVMEEEDTMKIIRLFQ
ncbi:FadR family transcriptional regulator [Halobacillus trueperi]|uniref:DNA-binding transcriptional regulator, FadR family n=2 Tax=Halobacillus TaxID=45667 RepID=A0A1H0E3N5_HALAD|nr:MULTISPECIES: GntR family transcriptional regulator [Halobacillus]RDY71242.1 FadR family transcriptional regulator [Halobacillus trueperi]SDN76888.1 DNA-binding transcriptional regulator, FadR family [Halobacillus aidingensis]